MSTREHRGYQMFPVLDGARVETALPPAARSCISPPGEMLYDHGQQGAPAWLVLSGSVDITRRDGRSSSKIASILAEWGLFCEANDNIPTGYTANASQ
jgi:hypothetical protein